MTARRAQQPEAGQRKARGKIARFLTRLAGLALILGLIQETVDVFASRPEYRHDVGYFIGDTLGNAMHAFAILLPFALAFSIVSGYRTRRRERDLTS